MELSLGKSVTQTLSKSEEKLFIKRPEQSDRLLPICEALKLSGFDVATIADIMTNIQLEPDLPSKIVIVNNRYLVYKPELVYDLHSSAPTAGLPEEPKRMALIFWI